MSKKKGKKRLNAKVAGGIAFIGFLFVLLAGTLVYIFSGKDDSTPKVVKSDLTAPENPSPLNPTESVTLRQAQKEDIQHMKKKGEYFPFDPAGAKTDFDINDFNFAQKNEKGQKDEDPLKLGDSLEDDVLRKVQEKKAKQAADARKRALTRRMWSYLWNNDSVDQVKVAAGEAYNLPEKLRPEPQGEEEGVYPSCMVRAVTVSAVTAVVGREFPLTLKVIEPADPDCLNVLPYGSTVHARVTTDYDLLKATGRVLDAVLPSGRPLKMAGYLFGPDRSYGIGLKVVRNDNKYLVMAATLGGLSVGFARAQDVHESNSYDAETRCYEWGCETVQDSDKDRDPTTEGLLAGGEFFFNTATREYLRRLAKKSPVLVQIPAGFPVFIGPELSAKR